MAFAPSGKRQAELFLPPLAEVHGAVEAGAPVRKLSLVNQQPGVHAPFLDRVHDLVERDHDLLEIRFVDFHHQVRRRELAGYGDFLSAQIVPREFLTADDDRPVAVPEAPAARHQRVEPGEIRERMEGHCGHVPLALHRLAVQGLDVGEVMPELERRRSDLVPRQRVEHEGVVRVRTVRHRDVSLAHAVNP